MYNKYTIIFLNSIFPEITEKLKIKKDVKKNNIITVIYK